MLSGSAQDLKSSFPNNNPQKILEKIIKLTLPALYRSGDPLAFKTDALARLTFLFSVACDAAADANKLNNAIAQIAQVFELDAEILKISVGELRESIKQVEGLNHFSQALNQLPILYDNAFTAYISYMPQILKDRQAEAKIKINEYKPPAAKLSANVKDYEFRQENVLTFADVEFVIPAETTLYKSLGWKPPQMFVDAIMTGGYVYLDSYGSINLYHREDLISEEALWVIKKNSEQSNLFYKQQGNGRRSYCIGYLEEVITADGNRYDIDTMNLSYINKTPFKFIEAKFAEYGKIVWQGKEVSREFWHRVDVLHKSIEKNGDVWRDLRQTNRTQKKNLGLRVYLDPYIPGEVVSLSVPDLVSRDMVIPKTNGGLSSINSSYDGCYISESIVNYIMDIMPTCNGFVLRRPAHDALIAIDDPSGEYYVEHSDYTIIDASQGNSGIIYITQDTSNSIDKFHYEKQLGKQGKVVDKTLARYHSQFNFNNEKDLEAAIAILTDSKCEVVNPLDIYVMRNTLYLAGQINENSLRLIKAKAPVKTTVRSLTTQVDVKVVSSGKPSDDNRSITDLLRSYFSQVLIIKGSQSHIFNFSIHAGNLEEKVKAAIQGDLIKIAFTTLAEAAFMKKDCKVEISQLKEEKSDVTMVTAEIANKDIDKFRLGLIPDKNNSRFLEYARAALKTIDLMGNKDKLSHPYISSATALMPIESMTSYRNRLLENILSVHLHDAVLKRDTQLVKILLHLNAHPEAVIDEVAKNGLNDILIVILEHGSRINLDVHLVSAAGAGHFETIKLLLSARADAGKCFDGNTALSKAAIGGYGEIVKYLLEKTGAHNVPLSGLDAKYEKTYQKKDVDSALGFIVRTRGEGYNEDQAIELAKLLIAAGANVNFRSVYNNCLGEAAKHGWYKLSAYLVENGASYDVPDYFGKPVVTPEQKEIIEKTRRSLKEQPAPLSVFFKTNNSSNLPANNSKQVDEKSYKF
jgi:hypothetical protein